MDRFQNSIRLAQASWKVLRDDKRLALLPLLSGVASLLVLAAFLVPMAIVSHDSATGGWTSKPVDWVLGIVGYFVVTYVVVFFNAALVFAADRRLRGEDVTIAEALHAAAGRAHVLLPWALLSATVSLVLRAVEQSDNILAHIAAMIAGIAWSLVTFLVLPILVVEQVGPIEAVRRSKDLFKRTWGEQVVANAGIGLAALLAIVVGLLPVALLVAIGGPLAVVGIVAFVLWIVAVSLVSSALTGILQMALYRFATDGTASGFDDDALRDAFRPRRGRRSDN